MEMAFSFLDDTSFLLAINELAYTVSVTWRLEVHNINGDASGAGEHVASLELPGLRSGAHVIQACHLLLRSDPNDATNRTSTTGQGGMESRRAFYPSSDERIIVFSFTVTQLGTDNLAFTEHNFSVVIHTPTLLRIVRTTSLPEVADLPSIPWQEWGPDATRWIDRRFLNGFVNDVHGQRYLTAETHRTRQPRLRLLDFNPYAIRKHFADHPDGPSPAPTDEWEGADDVQTRVIRQNTVIALPHVFEGPIVSNLPYTETIYPIPNRLALGHCAFCIDDEHILVFTLGVSSQSFQPQTASHWFPSLKGARNRCGLDLHRVHVLG